MNIYVSNLPDSITKDELKKMFEPFGTVESVHIEKVGASGMPSGMAYIIMPSDVEAEQAIAGLDGNEYQGQRLHVAPSDKDDFPTGNYW